MEDKKLKDKITFITGGAKGIGRAIVKAFCHAEADVYFCDEDENTAQQLCTDLKEYKCTFYKTDVSDAEALQNTVNKILDEKGDIDIVINNVGVSWFDSIIDFPIEKFDKLMNINLRPVFIIAKLLATHRSKNPESKNPGRIINMASTRYLMSEPDSEAYSASKGAIVSITHALAISLGKYNITVNSISPGWIENVDFYGLRPIDHEQHPAGRVGKPEDIAHACLFLCDPESDFITGQNIIIDGGMTRKMMYVER